MTTQQDSAPPKEPEVRRGVHGEVLWDQEGFESALETISVLAHPARFSIAYSLGNQGKSFAEIAKLPRLARLSRQGIYKHMHVMAARGIVESNRGSYKLTPVGSDICHHLEGTIFQISAREVGEAVKVFEKLQQFATSRQRSAPDATVEQVSSLIQKARGTTIL